MWRSPAELSVKIIKVERAPLERQSLCAPPAVHKLASVTNAALRQRPRARGPTLLLSTLNLVHDLYSPNDRKINGLPFIRGPPGPLRVIGCNS